MEGEWENGVCVFVWVYSLGRQAPAAGSDGVSSFIALCRDKCVCKAESLATRRILSSY